MTLSLKTLILPLTQLKSMRDRIVLSRECLGPLAPIIQVACSDDETNEDERSPEQGVICSNKPCSVQELPLHSEVLEHVCTYLDAFNSKVVCAIPGVSPGQGGCWPRQLNWPESCPLSKIEPPSGLPVDCYADDWLERLSGSDRCKLGIHSSPVLTPSISLLQSSIWAGVIHACAWRF